MKLEIRIGDVFRRIEINGNGPKAIVFDGKPFERLDALKIAPNTYSILLNGRAFEAVVTPQEGGLLIQCDAHEFHVQIADPRARRRERRDIFGSEGQQRVTTPMPGKVIRVLTTVGEKVEADQGLVVVEAMKMQNEIRAPRAGTIERILVREGQTVAAGEALITIG